MSPRTWRFSACYVRLSERHGPRNPTKTYSPVTAWYGGCWRYRPPPDGRFGAFVSEFAGCRRTGPEDRRPVRDCGASVPKNSGASIFVRVTHELVANTPSERPRFPRRCACSCVPYIREKSFGLPGENKRIRLCAHAPAFCLLLGISKETRRDTANKMQIVDKRVHTFRALYVNTI